MSNEYSTPYVALRQVTAGDYRRKVLWDLSWVWKPGEVWAVTGSNGAGKSALAAFLTGELLVYSGTWTIDPQLHPEAWIGFEPQRRKLEQERREDLSDVSDRPDAGTTALAFVGSNEVLAQVGLTGKEGRGLKQLSTGELRRAFLARSWNEPFWILDEPYEGLDAEAQLLWVSRVEARLEQGFPILFLSRKLEDFPHGITHVWELQEGRTIYQGPRSGWKPATTVSNTQPATSTPPVIASPVPKATGSRPLVLEFQEVTAGYGELIILQNFSWTVRSGERWLVRGPNGCGKSTLLSLISGEHPQAFQPGVKIFGKRRGAELTWAELHSRCAHLSNVVHQRFRDLWFTTLLEVVTAGFQDAVRPIKEPTWEQLKASREILAAMGLTEHAETLWEDLSWGLQRLGLLARALVTDPDLLLLDEPCQGLDHQAETLFQQALVSETIARQTTVLYVTHRPEERPFGDFQVLDLGALYGKA
ncbi:MAG: ATP-binding cassette domain-containing protein [Spirochaetales bacterium]|nr:ATP-binding cassette domain-containing protein [Spirochaetales bacterium]